MRKRDITSNQYLQDKARIADLLNTAVLRGKRLVRPENIQEWNPVNTAAQKYRDILNKVIFGCHAIFIGIENQDKLHYAMPVRTMGYDYSRYRAQYETIKKSHKQQKDLKTSEEYLSGFSLQDSLEAVITIVVYYGEEPWRGPRCLKDLLNLEEIPEELLDYINDYPLHIIEAAHFEAPELFETDLKLVFGCLKYQNHPDRFQQFLQQNRRNFQELAEDAYDMIAAFCHAAQLKDLKHTAAISEDNTEGGNVNMCKAIDELERRAREEGIALGEKRGEALGIERGIEMFILDNLEEGKTAQLIKDKLIRRFQLTIEQAEAYYLQFAGLA